eukprot:2711706-Rhodomonas_salina.3
MTRLEAQRGSVTFAAALRWRLYPGACKRFRDRRRCKGVRSRHTVSDLSSQLAASGGGGACWVAKRRRSANLRGTKGAVQSFANLGPTPKLYCVPCNFWYHGGPVGGRRLPERGTFPRKLQY